MKKLIFTLGVLLFLFSACSSLVDDVNINPNLPSDASSDLILTGLEVGAVALHSGHLARQTGLWSGYFKGIDRQYYGFYNYFILNSDFNGSWTNVYTDVIRNSVVLETKLEEENRTGIISGINKIIASHTFGMATALWGDIPYSEAGSYVNNNHPKYDNQRQIYEGIQKALDEAVLELSSPVGRPIENADIFFNGDPDSWKKVAYSLKARFYMHTKEYEKAYDNAMLGINSANEAWVSSHLPVNDAQNLVFQFYNGNRADELQSNETYFYKLMSASSESYKGDEKTDENARFKYLITQRSPTQFVANTTSSGAFSAVSHYPLFSFEENRLILAESALRVKGFAQGLVHLNELRAYFATGAHIGSGYQLESYKYEPFDANDFDGGGIASVAGLDRTQSLLRKILEEKFVSLFGQVETYNDFRRTFEEEASLPLQANVGDRFPQRFIYPQTEIDRNTSIPTTVPDIYQRTEVNK